MPTRVAQPSPAPPAILDTLVDVGGHRLHFRVQPGNGSVILFESGGGDALSVWDGVLPPIHHATGATLVTYDRAGFGTSEIDSTQLTIAQQITALKTGLSALGLDRDCVVVAHSHGGVFAAAFAARYPTQVKGAVLVDATQPAFWTAAQLHSFLTQYAPGLQQVRTTAPGRYWMYVTMTQLVTEMHETVFPRTVPTIALVSDRPFFPTADETTRWRDAQRQFVAAAPNRTLVVAKRSGHYVMNDRPDLVVRAVADMYRATQSQGGARRQSAQAGHSGSRQ